MIWLSLAFNYLGLTAIAAAPSPALRPSSVPLGRFVIGGVLQTAALVTAFPSREVASGLAFLARSWALPAICFLLIAIADGLGLV